MKELSPYFSPSIYIDFDIDVATSQSPVDVKSIAWRQESRQEATKLIIGSKNSH